MVLDSQIFQWWKACRLLKSNHFEIFSGHLSNWKLINTWKGTKYLRLTIGFKLNSVKTWFQFLFLPSFSKWQLSSGKGNSIKILVECVCQFWTSIIGMTGRLILVTLQNFSSYYLAASQPHSMFIPVFKFEFWLEGHYAGFLLLEGIGGRGG